MIDLIVIAISVAIFALLLVWWRWPAFRTRIEAPKYFMLRQERRFDNPAPRSWDYRNELIRKTTRTRPGPS